MQRSPRLGWLQWTLAGLAGALVLGSFLAPLVRAYLVRSAGADASLGATSGADAPRIAASLTRNGQTSQLTSDQVVFPGDRVQFRYSAKRPVQLALLHAVRDEAGVWYPPLHQGGTTVAAPAGTNRPIDLTLELDNRAGAERVYALFCESSQELEPIRRELQKTEELPRLPGCQVDSMTLVKKLR
jgi:hypothetical protein